MENPLLNLHTLGNNEYIPFDKIKNEHFESAFAVAFTVARENLEKIITNTEVATFENTIEAIEYCSEQLDAIVRVFTNLKEAHTNDEINRIAETLMPQLADWANDLLLNEKLFERVKYVFESNPDLKSVEQKRLLQNTYDSFVVNGALLSNEDKVLLRNYDQQIESLSESFASNVLNATNAYELVIDNEQDLAGLPERVREGAKGEAVSRGKDQSWIFTLQHPSYGPFLQYADSEKLRRELSIALASRAMSGEYNNQSIVLEMVSLRNKKAALLGFNSFADLVLHNRMAKTPQKVYDFFNELYSVARPKAEEDFEELRAHKELLTGNNVLESWDVSYIAEKIKQSKYEFNEEAFRPYFEINNVLESVFEHARRLYGLQFKQIKDIPVYHEDVTAYEIKDDAGKYVGTMYFDLFTRASKRGGAWIDALRMQHNKNGKNIRSQALIVGSLTKPTKTVPSLLSFWDVETLFHEFGHGMHLILSQCTYPSLAGFNSLWDFVEMPSQFMQAFATQKESLEIIGKHYQTGELIPAEFIEKNTAVKRFMAAYYMIGQIGAAALDMKWHDGSAIDATSVESFEYEARKPYRFFQPIPGTSHSATFSHIFHGGYPAGYYSYHWAEVLSADAFEYFKQNGLFNKDLAQSLKDNILSRGNTEEPMVLYKRFRGQEPDPHALLRIKGLL
ncbi:MAG: M3 family metallopeptidase [Candidatus Paceibacterota bacterium]